MIGEYYGHICDVVFKKGVKVLGKYEADIINYYVKVDSENKKKNYKNFYNGQEETIDGSTYSGRKIKALGIFKFKSPGDGDDFEANPDGNKKFAHFCQAIGINLQQTDTKVGDEVVKVNILPDLKAEDIENKPVVAVVGHAKPWVNKEGREVKGKEVKFVKVWPDGPKFKTTNQSTETTVTDDDLPF